MAWYCAAVRPRHGHELIRPGRTSRVRRTADGEHHEEMLHSFRFESSMVLTENDRKCFSLTYTRRTIRLQLNLLNESDNHESVIETLNAIRCLLLLVTHDNVHLVDFNQLGAVLDK
jgi:hypothetical protein